MIGWIRRLLGLPKRQSYTPPDEMIRTNQELDDILRRVDTEVDVRRNYSSKSDGKRNRDHMGSNRHPRQLGNLG